MSRTPLCRRYGQWDRWKLAFCASLAQTRYPIFLLLHPFSSFLLVFSFFFFSICRRETNRRPEWEVNNVNVFQPLSTYLSFSPFFLFFFSVQASNEMSLWGRLQLRVTRMDHLLAKEDPGLNCSEGEWIYFPEDAAVFFIIFPFFSWISCIRCGDCFRAVIGEGRR